MGLLEDVMKTMERIPAWRRVQDLPDRVTRLEERIQYLEAMLKPGHGKCPKCGAMEFTLQSSNPLPGGLGRLGALQDHMRCTNCGHTEVRTRNPSQQ